MEELVLHSLFQPSTAQALITIQHGGIENLVYEGFRSELVPLLQAKNGAKA